MSHVKKATSIGILFALLSAAPAARAAAEAPAPLGITWAGWKGDYRAAAKNDLASLPKVFDLKVNGVGYAASGGKVDAKLQGILEGYKAQIIEGKIKVADKP